MNQPEPQKPKIGQTHLGGMWRAGLKEIGQIMPALPDSVKPVEEMGLAGNALPQEVFQARHETEPNVDQNIEVQM
ncbi:MAG: hypothetical protein R3C59_11025 [Planctomycetaceae bacterium]